MHAMTPTCCLVTAHHLQVQGTDDACVHMQLDSLTSPLAAQDAKPTHLAHLLCVNSFPSSPKSPSPKASGSPLRLPGQRASTTRRSSSLSGPGIPVPTPTRH